MQTIVGVVDDVRYRGLTDQRLYVYVPAAQSTMRVKHLLIRTSSDPTDLAGSLRSIVRELDPAARIDQVESMHDVVAREGAPWRFAMRVLSGFGVVAAILAAAGLSGLVSLVVTLRRRELGIRSALGATPRRLRWHVLADALGIIVGGTVLGVLGASVLGHSVRALLVETAPADPIALAGAAAITVVAGTIGCIRPARRAVIRAPVEAIRQ
jgi:ABC-type antimicrobial peptide transport system permease subunit